MTISGSVTAALGDIHRDQIFHKTHFGVRDHKLSIQPDSDTLYGIGSEVKGVMASVVARLMKGKFRGKRRSSLTLFSRLFVPTLSWLMSASSSMCCRAPMKFLSRQT
ncbi:hypothetical protein B0T16DRAFT_174103 [Cercophora newfieldiana]|uniref:Beta-lactamase-related domain-containing protein n=1 Tax=Cercophora newfieldiana TaxID=92897 RepID=A0AA40CLI8_9PEZI|nr:hypothetical protein B0T16DRAFT_174103 [Cercophora newfieldiana]